MQSYDFISIRPRNSSGSFFRKGRRRVKKSHVRNFSGRPSREKISREIFFWGSPAPFHHFTTYFLPSRMYMPRWGTPLRRRPWRSKQGAS